MKSVIAFWIVTGAVLGGLLFWRNKTRYRSKSVTWLFTKSAVELIILFLTAAFLPALLIVWLVVWATRPIKTPWIRTIVGLAFGVVFGFLSNVALEVLIFLGLFSIDMKTGSHEPGGFLNCWRRAKQEETARQSPSAADEPVAA